MSFLSKVPISGRSVARVGEVLSVACGVFAVVAEVVPVVERHVRSRVVARIVVQRVVGAMRVTRAGLGTRVRPNSAHVSFSLSLSPPCDFAGVVVRDEPTTTARAPTTVMPQHDFVPERAELPPNAVRVVLPPLNHRLPSFRREFRLFGRMMRGRNGQPFRIRRRHIRRYRHL